ncbi:MAG: glutathione synthase [Ruminococcus sp.]|nr:glutathione synthase [Ruminococcus sp.]
MAQKQNGILGGFGLERETLRVNWNGRLAQTVHPFQDAYIQRDFCEYQLELITSVCENIEDMLTHLELLDRKVRTVLREQEEFVWLYSNPPYLEQDAEICIAQYHDKEESKFSYRKQLEKRYEKRKMLYSGIHFNLSFSKSYLKEQSALNPSNSITELQNRLYFQLFQQISRYSWLLVLLTSASPIYEKSLEAYGKSGNCFDGHGSMRSGEKGYWNLFYPILDFRNLPTYVESIRAYVREEKLFSASELYLPVRLKPRGENCLDALEQNGVNHLELRMFDLNPFEPLGIAKTDLEFSCFLLEYLLTKETFDFTPEMQVAAIRSHQAAAGFDLEKIEIDGIPAKQAANRIFDDMAHYFVANEKALATIAYERKKLEGERPCERVKRRLENDYTATVMRLSER